MATPIRSKKLKQASAWYKAQLDLHRRISKKARDLLASILKSGGVQCLDISSRIKDRDSFLKKAAKPKYKEPSSELKDVVGLRVITYFDSATKAVCEIIEREFKIDPAHSIDRGKLLGADRVGYRSVHYVATFSDERLKLTEYREFSGVCFEIQVRSILQHAWAEIEHDRRFKFPGELPPAINRRFSILAGVLELADREFDEIVSSIDKFAEQTLRESADRKSASRPINAVRVSAYLTGRFKDRIISGDVMPGLGAMNKSAETLLAELARFGVKTIGDLVKLIPANFDQIVAEFSRPTTFARILRLAMLLDDPTRYFEHAFRNDWSYVSDDVFAIVEAKYSNIRQLLVEHGIHLESEMRQDYDPDPEDYGPDPEDYDPDPEDYEVPEPDD